MDLEYGQELFKLLLLIFTVAFCFYWYPTNKRLRKLTTKVPIYTGFPLLGMFTKIRTMNEVVSGITEIMEILKSHTFCGWMGMKFTMWTSDPDIINSVLTSPELLNKPFPLYRPFLNFFGGGLLASSRKEWHPIRNMMLPAFTGKVLQGYFPAFHRTKQIAVAKFGLLSDKGTHKLFRAVKEISIANSLGLTMGIDINENAQTSENLTPTIFYLSHALSTHVFMATMCADEIYKKFTRFNKEDKELINIIRNEFESQLRKSSDPCINLPHKSESCTTKSPINFMDHAVILYNNNKITIVESINEIKELLITSFETTATALYGIVVTLAANPVAQEKLFSEIINHFPEKNFEMKYEHLKQLIYLDLVVKEVLRLIPPIPIFGRVAVRDTKLNEDIIIPKGTQVMILSYILHRCTDIWGPNATQFDPERFLPENFCEKQRSAYIPFSKGVRNCIGWRQAIYSIKVIIAGLVRNYRFHTTAKLENISLSAKITLKYILEGKLEIYRRTY